MLVEPNEKNKFEIIYVFMHVHYIFYASDDIYVKF